MLLFEAPPIISQPQPLQPKYSVMVFPKLVQPPAISVSIPQPHQYRQGYNAILGYVVAHGRPIMEERRPCFGIRFGWFFPIPWYIEAFILLCARMNHMEKPGLIACTIAGLRAQDDSTSTGMRHHYLLLMLDYKASST